MSRIRVYDITLMVEDSEAKMKVGQADLKIAEIKSIALIPDDNVHGLGGEAKTVVMKKDSMDFLSLNKGG